MCISDWSFNTQATKRLTTDHGTNSYDTNHFMKAHVLCQPREEEKGRCVKKGKTSQLFMACMDSSDSDKDNTDNNQRCHRCDNHNVEDIRNDVTLSAKVTVWRGILTNDSFSNLLLLI